MKMRKLFAGIAAAATLLGGMAAGWRLDRRTRSTAGWRGWRLEQQEASRLRRFLGLDCPTNLRRAAQPFITNLWVRSMLGFGPR